jgi:arylsulfatase A
MTGQYNVRNYINTLGTMDPEATTFAQHFRRAGYRTAMAGKWQLGADRALPGRFGSEERLPLATHPPPPRYANPGLEYNGVERDFTRGEYGPDLVHEFARGLHRPTPCRTIPAVLPDAAHP